VDIETVKKWCGTDNKPLKIFFAFFKVINVLFFWYFLVYTNGLKYLKLNDIIVFALLIIPTIFWITLKNVPQAALYPVICMQLRGFFLHGLITPKVTVIVKNGTLDFPYYKYFFALRWFHVFTVQFMCLVGFELMDLLDRLYERVFKK